MLRDDERLGDAWLLAITVAAKGRMADSVLNAGADDYLHRPFTRAELIARTRAGLRAAQERSNDRLLRTLMENVPGAIYRSRLARGLPAGDDHRRDRADLRLPAARTSSSSTKRTILSLVHPDDIDMVLESIALASADSEEPFELEYRIVRDDGEVRWVLDRGQLVRGPGGRLWLDGAMFDITERRAAEEALLAPRGRGGPHGRAARLPRPHHRGRRQGAAQDRARPPRRRPAAARRRWCSTSRWPRRRLAKDPTGVGPFLERLGRELQDASAELRELARGIHPAVLTERGLAAAVGALATRCAVPVEVVDPLAERLPPAVEATAYFTVAEALTNVAKYAEATHAVVTLARDRRRTSWSRSATTGSAARPPAAGSG